MQNTYGFKTGDCFKIYLPEHIADHTPIRACIILETDYTTEELYILPFTTKEGYNNHILQTIPIDTKDNYRNITEFGGRDRFGYIAPNIAGWIKPDRLREKLGLFTTELYTQILEEYKLFTDIYQPYNYY